MIDGETSVLKTPVVGVTPQVFVPAAGEGSDLVKLSGATWSGGTWSGGTWPGATWS